MKEFIKNKKMGLYLALHSCLMISSLGGICSKMAGKQETFWGFILWYGGVLGIMAIYAAAWQQILKKMPLTVAYANKPVSLIWGMIWGALLFQEKIKWSMLLGAGIIFIGIYFVVTADE